MGIVVDYLCIILGSILLMMITRIEANKCPVSVDFLEIKRNYECLKGVLHENDMNTDISFIKESVLNQIHESEQCCFLLKLGKFYLGNVFPNLRFTQKRMHRYFNNLANTLLGMKTDLKHCHSTMRCPCGEQSLQRMEEFKNVFYKMETLAAARKAVGDLNILFHWMEKNFLE